MRPQEERQQRKLSVKRQRPREENSVNGTLGLGAGVRFKFASAVRRAAHTPFFPRRPEKQVNPRGASGACHWTVPACGL